MKIVHKLSISFIAIALLFFIIGLISAISSQNILRRIVGENSVMHLRHKINEIDRNLFHRIEQVRAYAQYLSENEELIRSNQEFSTLSGPTSGWENIQDYINEKEKEWRVVPKETITPFMEGLINSKLSVEIKKQLELKEFYIEKYGYEIFIEIFVTNRYGANVAQTQKTTDYRQDDETWWQKTKENGFYISDVEYDHSASAFSIDICSRIDDKNGNFLGIVKAVLNIEEVIDIMRSFQEEVEKEGYIRENIKTEASILNLLTQNGKLIFSKKGYVLFEDRSDLLLRVRSYEDKMDSKGYFISEIDKNRNLLAHVHSEGYKDYKGLGWILVIGHNVDEIFGPITNLRNVLIFVFFCSAVFAIIFGIYISHSISYPIEGLKIAAHDIGEGRLNTKIRINTGDEIEELADSINRMSGELLKTTVTRDSLLKEVSIRKKTEENLKAIEKRTRAIIENANDAFVSINSKGIVIDWNPQSERTFGWSREEIMGKMIEETIIPHKYRKAHLEGIKHFMNTGEGSVLGKRIELLGLHRDGHEFPIEITISSLKWKDEIIFNAFIHDIAKRKNAEKEILNLARFPQENPFPVLRISKDKTLLYANQGAYDLFVEQKIKINKRMPEFWCQLIDEVFNSGEIRDDIELEMNNRDYEWVMSPILEAGYANVYGKDITDRKKVEKSKHVLMRAIEQSSNMVIITDVKGNIEYVNPEFTKVTGYTFEEVLGKNPRFLQSGHTDSKVYEKLWKTITSGDDWKGVCYNVKKDGTFYWGESKISAVYNIEGDIVNYIEIQEDITKRVEADRKLEKLIKKLQDADTRLMQAEKMESVGRLAAGVAHEVKNPLAIIQMSIDYLSDTISTDKTTVNVLNVMKNAVTRADKIIKGLLFFSSQTDFVMETEDLNLVIDDAIKMIKYELDKKRIIISKKYSKNLPKITIDRTKIEQVFINIFLNSIHAMDVHGELSVEINARTILKQRDKVDLEDADYLNDEQNIVGVIIEDTGCGIPEDTLKNIFDPFFTTKLTGEGTGLGLSVSKRILDAHNADINFQNRSERGVRVEIRFPVL